MGFQRSAQRSAQELKRTCVEAKSQCEHFSFRFSRLSCEKYYCVTSVALTNPVEKQAPAHPYLPHITSNLYWAETIGLGSVSTWNTSLVRLTSRSEALHVMIY